MAGGISYGPLFSIHCDTGAVSNAQHRRFSGTAPNKRVLHGKMHAVVSSEWHNETMR